MCPMEKWKEDYGHARALTGDRDCETSTGSGYPDRIQEDQGLAVLIKMNAGNLLAGRKLKRASEQAAIETVIVSI